jgi:uncharacterized protein with von Willebrand factor type A (vWA) domain
MRRKSAPLNDQVEKLGDTYSGLEDVPENIWRSFFHRDIPAPTHEVIEKIHKHSSFKQMRKYSVGDIISSTFATMGILDRILDGEIQVEKPEPKQPSYADAKNAGSLKELIDVLQIDEYGDPIDTSAQDAEAEALAEMYTDAAITDALDEAEEKAMELKVQVSALGCGHGLPEWNEMSDELKLNVADKLQNDKELKKLVDMAGRLFLSLDQKRRSKYTHGRDEIVGVETASDITRLLPSELAKAAHEKTRPEFYRSFLEHSLLQYEMRGEETLNKGPFIILQDQSSSMRGIRDQWAKALVLAIWKICRKDNREVIWVPFSSQVGEEVRLNKDTTLMDIFEMLKGFMGGGTNFEKPLAKATGIAIAHAQTTSEGALDIILITDGECGVSSWIKRHNENRDLYEFSTLGIQIGTRNTESLEQVCDKVSRVDPNAENEEVLQWITNQS